MTLERCSPRYPHALLTHSPRPEGLHADSVKNARDNLLYLYHQNPYLQNDRGKSVTLAPQSAGWRSSAPIALRTPPAAVQRASVLYLYCLLVLYAINSAVSILAHRRVSQNVSCAQHRACSGSPTTASLALPTPRWHALALNAAGQRAPSPAQRPEPDPNLLLPPYAHHCVCAITHSP